ncbi:hypothetical protein [Homoserinimonas sp. OAct 916]|uniref:hypothetical protein n=1 Tax=Homoserinimonas sp. OAct 916 TaxID=2211450 RepID=UPI000DBE188F|nr:hypothetical protein [Homoserinimonas sp. OAct 916]
MQPGDEHRTSAATPSDPDATPGRQSPSPQVSAHRNRRTCLLWVAGVIVSAGILIGLFYLGTTLGATPAGPSARPSSSPSLAASTPPSFSPSPLPVVPEPSTGPAAEGEHPWDQLRGGECLQPFDTPWAETFAVVDCGKPHASQMVFTDVFEGGPEAPYPGADALAEQIPLLCGTPDVIDFAAAEAYTDIRVEGTYPLTDAQWGEEQRNYYCFVNRASGDPIEGSLAAG